MNKRYIDQIEYQNLVARICREISLSDWRPEIIVGITRGGLFPAVLISHYFDVPMQALHISLRDNDENCESNLWLAEDAYNGKNILVVDDINDSGATINWLMQDWQCGCHPSNDRWVSIWNNNVKFAAIIDNTASACKLTMDFVGEEINKQDNDWIVFPYESWWG